MISAHRTWHRRMFTGLAVLLPALFLMVARDRGAVRAAPSATTEVMVDSTGSPLPHGPSLTVLPNPRISAELVLAPEGRAPVAVFLTPSGDPGIPDLLVYWAPTAGDGATLPPDAMLLGTMRGSRPQLIQLPEPGMMHGGFLILYSLGWSRVMSTTSMSAAS